MGDLLRRLSLRPEGLVADMLYYMQQCVVDYGLETYAPQGCHQPIKKLIELTQ